MYLAVGTDKVELTLKQKADQYDTLFVFRREHYPNDSILPDTAIESGSFVFVESWYKTFMQTYYSGASQKSVLEKFDYKLKKHSLVIAQLDQTISSTSFPCVFSHFNKNDRSKMIF
jgi:hypothetical protein